MSSLDSVKNHSQPPLTTAMTVSSIVRFGPFIVTNQVFYRSANSFGLVNLKPILPGHVLVCPNRVISRITDLSTEEASDFYNSVQVISKAIEVHYKADSLNIAIQDGPLAGQTVPHVHCHIIPRRLGDLPNVDDIYKLLNGKEGDLEYTFKVLLEAGKQDKTFQNPDQTREGPRTEAVMNAEALELSRLFVTQ